MTRVKYKCAGAIHDTTMEQFAEFLANLAIACENAKIDFKFFAKNELGLEIVEKYED